MVACALVTLPSVAVFLSAAAAGAACGSSDAASTSAGAADPTTSSSHATGAGASTPTTTSGTGGADAATTGTGSPASGGGTPTSAGGGGAGTTSDPTGRAAIAAVDFLGSIGVCTHVGQGVDAPDASATALAFAGIRALRDDGRPEHVQDWISMHASAGVRVALLTNQDVSSTVDMAKSLAAAGALLAVEGPNEPNNFPGTYGGMTSDYATTFVPVAHLQRDLYAAVKAEPTLAGLPVFHASEAGGSEPDNVGLQFLTIPAGANIAMPDGTQYADYANTHNYVCGHSSQLVDNVAWSASDPTLNGDWDGPYVEYGHTWHGGFDGYSNADLVTLPKVTTETGWVTQGTNAISEEQQARVFLNLYLAAYVRGWAYTFVYMLRDDPVQGYWGLFDTSYQPKRSGTYLHNLTTILDDAGGGATGLLDYSIASEPATVHDLLLQKGDGTFELVVWNERPSGGSDDVTIDLGHPRATVRVYDPTTGATATNTQHGVGSVTVTLTDHPVVLEI